MCFQLERKEECNRNAVSFKQVSVIFHVDLGLCPQVICFCQMEHGNHAPSPADDYS